MYDVTKVIKNETTMSYLPTCSFSQKTSRYNVFRNETPDRMSYLKTLYGHFKYFQFSKYPKPFSSFRSNFHLKTI